MAATPSAVAPARARRAGRRSPATLRDFLLAVLTFSSGAVDAIAFLALGKVFTAFQTGNVVFLGFKLADAGGPNLVRVAASLAGFAAGVLVATRVVGVMRAAEVWSARASLALGLTFLAQVAFAVVWLATSGHPGMATGDVLAAMSAVAMGVQSATVLALGVPGVFTTAATATVIFLMRDTAEGREAPAAEPVRLLRVLGALVAGAAAGGLLLMHARTAAPLLPLAGTALVITAAHQLIGRTR